MLRCLHLLDRDEHEDGVAAAAQVVGQETPPQRQNAVGCANQVTAL